LNRKDAKNAKINVERFNGRDAEDAEIAEKASSPPTPLYEVERGVRQR
jgi:hypothetical protein